MGSLFTRMRSAAGLVRRSVERDLMVRRLYAADTALGEGSAGRVRLPARRPFSTRELPASAVPMQSGASHAVSTFQEVVRSLQRSGACWIAHGEPQDGVTVLGIVAEDWASGLVGIQRDVAGVLIGLAATSKHASLVEYYEDLRDAETLASSNIAYVLIPAITEHNGAMIKRHGFETAVRLEKWRETGATGELASSAWNPRTALLSRSAFDPSGGAADGQGDAEESEMGTPHLMQVTFPIDAVYTWVDGTDPAWIERKRRALEENAGQPMPEAAVDDLRFVGHDELRHSLRSLELYAPWIRHVYLVTDGQRPEWLREDSDWITVVDHRDIAPPGTVLPTFNSQAIEANIHRIDGLSEHFLYFNDDMFLSSPVRPELFFHANGLASMYLSRAQVAPGDPVEGEPAPDAAGKNARRLVQEVSGRRLSRKLFHAPYALRRSVSYEIEDRWPEIVQRTRDSQFRRLEDVTLAGGLHLNYAYATARAVSRGIRYRYVGIGERTAAAELRRLIADKDTLQTFCLNDAVQELPADVVDQQVRAFLAERFPDVGSFEKLDRTPLPD